MFDREFFTGLERSNGTVKKIAKEFENLPMHVLDKFTKEAGYPIWDKTAIRMVPANNSSTVLSRDGESRTDSCILVPVVLPDGKETNGFISVLLTDGEVQNMRMFYRNDYKAYPYDLENSDSTKTTAEEFVTMTLLMDKEIFGYKNFNINEANTKLFDKDQKPLPDSLIMYKYIEIPDNASLQEFCTYITITETTFIRCSNPPSSVHVSNSSNAVARCGLVFETTTELEICHTVGIPYGGGGTGGGAGGGGAWPTNPNTSGNPNCVVGAFIVNGILQGTPCNSSGNDTPNDPKDASGFLESRKETLKIALRGNQVETMPCDSILRFALHQDSGLGLMYQRIAQFLPSQQVITRLDSIRNVAPNLGIDLFNLQSLSEAFGSLANIDMFPIKIDTFPTGMSSKTLLEYFRLNINSFISPNIGVSFQPYRDGNFTDYANWIQPFEQSLGSIVDIRIGVDDGSVILSEYYNFDNGIQQKNRFKFSTLETPLNGDHPVAGTREFGVYNTIAQPNQFTFYIMAVDRVDDDLGRFIQEIGFRDADALWRNIQQNMITFINSNGGKAGYFGPRDITTRPMWDLVAEYLKGNITYAQFKTLIGC